MIRRGRRLFLVVFMVLLVGPAPALSQGFPWDRSTREEGIDRLRQLVADYPEAVEPRLELGRVLTWNGGTRDEGILLLREVSDVHPENAAVAEALSEVLAWNPRTRLEARSRLRELMERQPERVEARLLLAEILSWSRPGRAEAELIYESVLKQHPDNIEARTGLARLKSWQGDLEASRLLYGGTLQQDPDNQAARLGLAEVHRWSGRSRASLALLDEIPPDAIPAAETHRRRAEAYEDLGRPALALQEYDALLALDPDDEPARRKSLSLNRQLRPRLEVGLAFRTESGDWQTDKLNTESLPVKFAWHPSAGDTEVYLLTDATRYRNDSGTTNGLSAGIGVDAPLGHRVRLRGEGRFLDFDEAGNEVVGRIEGHFAIAQRLTLHLAADRRTVQDSQLSASGEEIAGVLYGPVVLEEVQFGFSVLPARYWDLYARGAIGSVEGDNVLDNDRDTIFAGFGRSFRGASSWWRLSYNLAWLSYDRDLSGFPPGDLAGDGIDSVGAGGYFSPFRFLNHMVRVDATIQTGEEVHLFFGAGIGRQEVTDIGAPAGDDRTSSDAYVGVAWRLTEDFSLKGRINYEDVASAFDRTRASLTLIWSF